MNKQTLYHKAPPYGTENPLARKNKMTLNIHTTTENERAVIKALMPLTLCYGGDRRRRKLETYQLGAVEERADGRVLCQLCEVDERGRSTGKCREMYPTDFLAWIPNEKKHVTASTLVAPADRNRGQSV